VGKTIIEKVQGIVTQFVIFWIFHDGHWFSLIKSGKNYWAKVRETKKQI
jgi:hypothetical protein